MREQILSIIEKNSRIDIKELAVILGAEEIDIANELKALEDEGVICGYHTMIDWEKTSIEKVTALIEVRITPQRGQGYDNIAERIYKYPEVHAVYLTKVSPRSRLAEAIKRSLLSSLTVMVTRYSIHPFGR